MASKYWIKLYHEILDDHKMGMLPDHLYRRVIEIFLLAGEKDEGGLLPSIEAMSWRLRTKPEELEKDFVELAEKNIVNKRNGNWIVTKFAERQAPMDKAEYMRRKREQEKIDEYYGDVTFGNETVTDNKQNSKTDTDKKRIDKEEIKSARSDFSEFQKVWEQETGQLVSGFTEFERMCKRFKIKGVTPDLYRTAIQEQKQSNYPVKRPTSVEEWALGLVTDNNASTKKEFIGPDGEILEI
jgi:DNA-binding transcriptional regulator YhcF (GntR family)